MKRRRPMIRKLYADVAADDGSVAVVYMGWCDAGPVHTAYGALESYSPDGRRTVLHGRVPGESAIRRLKDGREWLISLELGEGVLHLRYREALSPWQPRGPRAHPGVNWSVLVPRAKALLAYETRGGTVRLEGTGYADRVELDRPPRLLGLRSLQWGRMHLPGGTIVFDVLRMKDRAPWMRAAGWSGQERLWESSDLHPSWAAETLRVATPDAHATISTERVLHRGPALDEERFPRRLERWLSRAGSGPAQETRWLGRARDADDGSSGWALHELVSFGPEARHGASHTGAAIGTGASPERILR